MAKRWYVINVFSGAEKKIAQQIRDQAAKSGLSEQIEEIVVPSEQVIEVRRGQKVATEHTFLAGYVLAKLEMTDQIWHLVMNTPKVTGFLGTKMKPSPISDAEAERMLRRSQESSAKVLEAARFSIGEQIRVAEGPFASFQGTVEQIDEDSSRLKVTVSIFGRSTPVDLDFGQVEKL
jgi:transcription termination/antitermination protein NusG